MSALQMNSGADVDFNLKSVEHYLAQAQAQGVQLVVLPEMFACMAPKSQILTLQEEYRQGVIQATLRRLAITFNLWIVAGTLPITSTDPSRYFASTLVISSAGEIVARYNKIHLYDISLTAKEHYLESETTCPGSEVVVVDTPFGKMGLAVCYDVRFPELFRSMIQQGAQFIALPSAFVHTTGKDHWEVLLRARAIENSCYIIASNQFGHHDNGYHTYGHSMIVDPRGTIMESASADQPCLVTSRVDIDRTDQVRRDTPFVKHRRIF